MIENMMPIDKLKKFISEFEFNENDDIENLIDLGFEYIEQNDFLNAFKVFKFGIKIDETNPDMLYGLGMSLCELGRYKASRIVFEKSVEIYPEDAIALANLAGAYWEEGEYNKAIHFYYRSLEIDSNIIETHLNLINLYYEKDDLYMAYITSLNLLELFPTNKQAKELRDDIIMSMAISI
ncbi:MAG: tetratricopeptide repeat protein [Spirochaetota bacterium]|nr:tetratricopeptide repeat protein [Spirochaetota bacterium]